MKVALLKSCCLEGLMVPGEIFLGEIKSCIEAEELAKKYKEENPLMEDCELIIKQILTFKTTKFVYGEESFYLDIDEDVDPSEINLCIDKAIMADEDNIGVFKQELTNQGIEWRETSLNTYDYC
jgi:hypothetical protein